MFLLYLLILFASFIQSSHIHRIRSEVTPPSKFSTSEAEHKTSIFCVIVFQNSFNRHNIENKWIYEPKRTFPCILWSMNNWTTAVWQNSQEQKFDAGTPGFLPAWPGWETLSWRDCWVWWVCLQCLRLYETRRCTMRQASASERSWADKHYSTFYLQSSMLL